MNRGTLGSRCIAVIDRGEEVHKLSSLLLPNGSGSDVLTPWTRNRFSILCFYKSLEVRSWVKASLGISLSKLILLV